MALEFAVGLFAGDDMTDARNIREKADAVILCEAFGMALLDGHFIVDRSKARAGYSNVIRLRDCSHGTGHWEAIGMARAYERIFGHEASGKEGQA